MSRSLGSRGWSDLPLLVLAVVSSTIACSIADTSTPADRVAGVRAAQISRGREIERISDDGGRGSATSPVTPVSCDRRSLVVGSGVFGPSGGTLIVGESRLVIPGGALRDTVTISGSTGGDATSTIRFSPEGLRFRKPAGLTLSGSGCRLPERAEFSVVYLDDEGRILETIAGEYFPRYKVVAAPIEHFSGYAIAF